MLMISQALLLHIESWMSQKYRDRLRKVLSDRMKYRRQLTEDVMGQTFEMRASLKS